MKWEYLLGVIGDYVDAGKDYVFVGAIINDDRRITFNELGEKGWELVSIVKGIAYFKRPKPDTKDTALKIIENYFVSLEIEFDKAKNELEKEFWRGQIRCTQILASEISNLDKIE